MIVHLVSDRFSVGGGLEHMFQIVRGLPDIYFRIFAMPSPGYSDGLSPKIGDKFSGLKNVELDSRGFTPKLVLEKIPDLVHIHHLRPLFQFYKNPLKRYTVPVVFTAHGLHLHKYEFPSGYFTGVLQNKLKYWLRYVLEKYLFSRADQVIAVSHEDREFVEKKYGLGHVVYLTNGIEPPKSGIKDDSRSQLRKLLNLPESHFLFVTVARFDFQKGYDFLVRVIGTMKDFLKQHQVGFVFVGTGPEIQPTRLMAEKLQVSPFIFFLGERSDVSAVIKAGDVFLLPSRWEGLPIVLLECGLLRIPVIASDTYGNREILGKRNGILFENLNEASLANVIQTAVRGGYDFTRFSDLLYREVRENYSLEKMITGLSKIYHSLSH